ncbi:putative uncharacterized protein [Clostridium sp. CAG:632]|jgi:predicted transcriptional regulator|nr:BlaI/MecI/CopY family transcriptional regulator [Clostridium sp.]MDD6268204.1 BlaI/MecI/CopY family transcriptional regulator [Clostridium sp.]CCY59280.1 putative uncharacterized protein [Clostridium sp. CAG:632]
MRRAELSECELLTMKCIWDAGEPVTCHQIMDQLREKYGLVYKDTTVYTFLKCLKGKGFVASQRKGVTYYWSLRSEVEYRNDQLRKAEDFWFNGSAVSFVSTLFEIRELKAEEKEEIKKLIDELK